MGDRGTKSASFQMNIHKIHITGGPASGKTSLAKRIAGPLALPLYELDEMALQLEAAGKSFIDIAGEAQCIAELDHWVSEGAYMGWAEPLFQQADIVIWLDISWRIASYRILSRHIRATIARNNRFPEWQRLLSFWSWSRRYYQNTARPGLNDWGVPRTKQTAISLLQPYKSKLVTCLENEEIEALVMQRFGISAT